MKTKELFLNRESIAKEYINDYEYPFQMISDIKQIILELGQNLHSEYQEIKENVWVHKSVKMDKNIQIIGPCIIDAESEIRQDALIRENVIIGKNVLVGHSCEVKNSILFDGVKLGHFNYVGDSILGYKVHLGAGSIISNVKGNNLPIQIKVEDQCINTNMRKVGAFLGDSVEIGCNSVLNPGTIIGPYSQIYPLVAVRGVIPSKSIVKNSDTIILKEE
ncbi:MAG: UDP-N-acetylglucosamine pyrophosphorylase [Bacilli bacterium]|nr:UDP-N-acetylglucosamine pyrophosphorylase [Bacilli bacterium]